MLTPRNRLAATFLLICGLAVACSAQEGSSPAEGPRNVSQKEVLDALEAPERVMILDVRSPKEFAAGHVPGAVNIPHDQLASRIAEVDTDREGGVVIYCESGRRASYAAETLREAGVENLGHLDGDMQAWRAAQLPRER